MYLARAETSGSELQPLISRQSFVPADARELNLPTDDVATFGAITWSPVPGNDEVIGQRQSGRVAGGRNAELTECNLESAGAPAREHARLWLADEFVLARSPLRGVAIPTTMHGSSEA